MKRRLALLPLSALSMILPETAGEGHRNDIRHHGIACLPGSVSGGTVGVERQTP